MASGWEYCGTREDGYYHILAHDDGDRILEEIVAHFESSRPTSADRAFIVDMHLMEHDFAELRKFQRRVAHYERLGYEIMLTF
ncbi:hypothetical protein [Cohnella sp.]|uniref:hypothetical protein n=1 Tax=Cohnella sp. TaxID=1883426 RepID=UPI003567D1BA